MKKLMCFFISCLTILGIVGCQSSVIKERCPIDLKSVLEKTIIASESVGVVKKDIIKQEIVYNEAEDSFYINLTLKDEFIGTVGTRIDELLAGKQNKYNTFCFWYIKNLNTEIENKNINNEKINLQIQNASASYNTVKRIR